MAPDSYLGHLEMIAADIQPQLRTLDDVRPIVRSALDDHTVTTTDTGVLLVDETIAIYDNLDADQGLSLCVLGSRDQTPTLNVTTIATKIRAVIDLPRVIAGSGAGWHIHDILDRYARSEQTLNGRRRHGLNNGLAGIHSRHYRVTHLPHTAVGDTLLTRILTSGQRVILVGKTAELFPYMASRRYPTQDTRSVEAITLSVLAHLDRGLVFANVQAFDLSCHAGDISRAAAELEVVDRALAAIARALRSDDQLIVTADHGNDPTAGGAHTFEHVPVLGTSEGPISGAGGLADIAELVAGHLL
ncbi:MAG: hypothetical protein J2P18_04575 [Nocardia sp.]|nr:hypothetical protein [Nocardia sp.]